MVGGWCTYAVWLRGTCCDGWYVYVPLCKPLVPAAVRHCPQAEFFLDFSHFLEFKLQNNVRQMLPNQKLRSGSEPALTSTFFGLLKIWVYRRPDRGSLSLTTMCSDFDEIGTTEYRWASPKNDRSGLSIAMNCNC